VNAGFIATRFLGPPDAYFQSINPTITPAQLPAIRLLGSMITWCIMGLALLVVLFVSVMHDSHP